MFNLQAFSSPNINELIHKELNVLGIEISSTQIVVQHNSEYLPVNSLDELTGLLQDAEKETKQQLLEGWHDLSHVSDVILENTAGNNANLNNIIFLHCLKWAAYLSGRFSQLKKIHQKITELFNLDMVDVHGDLIHKFNKTFYEILSNHCKLLTIQYKTQLLSKLHSKYADINGPWSNADLSMDERVQDWRNYYQSDFDESTKWKSQQSRYNPEYTPRLGVYFEYDDLNRDPYLFDDRDEESPYPVTESASIP